MATTLTPLRPTQKKVESMHIAKAIGYRNLDRSDWAEWARKLLVLTSMLLVASMPASAQQAEPGSGIVGSLKADVVSSYIFRGLHNAHASVQPEMTVGWKGLSLSAWGSVALTNHTDNINEIDLTLSYETGGLSVGVADYWTDYFDNRYFYYEKKTTGHSFEGILSYDFGPVAVSWQTIFAGNDFQKDEDGKRAYSSYLEVTAPFRLVTCDWEATAGLVPWASDCYETTGFSVTNVSLRATKDIKITDSFSLPIFGQLIANPCSQHFYFVAGITLIAF